MGRRSDLTNDTKKRSRSPGMAWYCHECAVSFEADFSVDAREVRCVRCQGAFVEFMPQAIPPSLSSRRSDDDLDDEGYREEEEEEYY